jgi:hypothetical protein
MSEFDKNAPVFTPAGSTPFAGKLNLVSASAPVPVTATASPDKKDAKDSLSVDDVSRRRHSATHPFRIMHGTLYARHPLTV